MLVFHSTQTVSTSQTFELLHFLQKPCYEKHFSFVYVWCILSEIFENNPFKFVTKNRKDFFLLCFTIPLFTPYLWYSSLGSHIPNKKPATTLQKRVVRIMTFSEPRSHSEPLLKSLRLLKFSDIIHLEILSFVYQLSLIHI